MADAGSYAAAADRLNVTQAAVSQQVRALEERLGVALLPETLRPVRVSAGDPSAWPAPALLVPSPEGDDPETLVVPTTGYRSGTRLTLWDGPPRDTRLGVRLAGSPDIAQYTLRPAV